MVKHVSRRKFIKYMGAAALSAGSLNLPGRVLGQSKTYTIKFATPAPESHPWYFPKAMTPFKEEVERESKGKLLIEFYPNQILVKVGGELQSIRSRIVQAVNFATVWQPGLFPLHEVWYLPGACTASAKFNNDMYRELLPKYFEKEWAQHDLHVLGWYIPTAYGVYHLHTPINKVEDFSGIDLMSWSPQQNKVLSKLKVDLRAGTLMEMYDNLQKKLADGVAHNAATVVTYKLHELGKPGYYSQVGGLGGGDAFYAISKSYYDGLPKELKTIIDKASRKWLQDSAGTAYDTAENEAAGKMQAVGVKYIDWSAAEKKRLRDDYLLPTLKQWSGAMDAKGLQATTLVDAIVKAREAGGR